MSATDAHRVENLSRSYPHVGGFWSARLIVKVNGLWSCLTEGLVQLSARLEWCHFRQHNLEVQHGLLRMHSNATLGCSYVCDIQGFGVFFLEATPKGPTNVLESVEANLQTDYG
jgi:hypothetical protein